MGIIMTNKLNLVEFTATLNFHNINVVLRDNLYQQAANVIKKKMALEGCIPGNWWYAILDNPRFKGNFYKYWKEESSHPCGREPELILVATVKVLNIGGHQIMVSHKWDGPLPKGEKVLLYEKNCYQFWELKDSIKDSKFIQSKTGGGFFD